MGVVSRVDLGDKVQDLVSGFVGVAAAIHKYLEGCERVSVQPMVADSEPGKLPDALTFDIGQLKVLEEGFYYKEKAKLIQQEEKKPGGPDLYPETRRVDGAKPLTPRR